MKKLIIFLFLSLDFILNAADYYVAKDGSNGNPGTITQPFLTIVYAESRMSGGDTCFIRGGTYIEHPIIDGISGTTTNPTVFMAYNNERVIIDGTGISVPDGSGLIRVRDNDVHLIGLEVQNTNHVGVSSGVDAFNLLIKDCIIHDIQGGGIGAFGDNTIIEYVTAYNCAMSNYEGSAAAIGDSWGQGITIRTSNSQTNLTGGIIRHCTVYDIWGEGISFSGMDKSVIEDCIIYNTYSVALYVRNSQNCTLQRNLIYQMRDMAGGQSRGISHWNEAGMEWFPNLNNRIINNIVYGCRRNFQTASLTTGLLVANNTFVNSTYIGNVCLGDYEYVSMEFKNNIVIQGNSLPCVYMLADDQDVVFSNNLYNKSYNSYAFGTGDIISEVNIKKEGSQYQYKYYELQSDSPAINAGIVVPVMDDYLGIYRDIIDIGALEYKDASAISEISSNSKKVTYKGARLISGIKEVTNNQIIIDHNSVALYDNIPDYYISEVKKMRGLIAGLSHASGYLDGLKQLEIIDPKYQVLPQYTGTTPSSYITTELRFGKNIWDAITSTWVAGYEEDQWTNGVTNTNNTKNGITYTITQGYDLDVMGFGWCYDYQELTVDLYLSVTQDYVNYCSAKGYDTKMFFSTGPVDAYSTEDVTTHASNYWYANTWESIRDYVATDENLILFDYADILCYNDLGVLRTQTYSGNAYPWIHLDNMAGGMTDGHIGYNGAVRLAKALWVLMARIAGWDGN